MSLRDDFELFYRTINQMKKMEVGLKIVLYMIL